MEAGGWPLKLLKNCESLGSWCRSHCLTYYPFLVLIVLRMRAGVATSYLLVSSPLLCLDSSQGMCHTTCAVVVKHMIRLTLYKQS